LKNLGTTNVSRAEVSALRIGEAQAKSNLLNKVGFFALAQFWQQTCPFTFALQQKARHGRAFDCGLDSRSEWVESNATPFSYARNVITFEVVGDELTTDWRRVPHLINASRFSAEKLCWS
jgi:hypothetical protein